MIFLSSFSHKNCKSLSSFCTLTIILALRKT